MVITKKEDLSKERQGEIALLILKHQLASKPIPAPNEIKRELGNIAKAINIPLQELIYFAKPLYEEALNKGLSEIVIVPKEKNA